ncbi:hypothetical protein [Nesterenkonia cremea]|uniref:Uncharacterized protein n=1 Tax=Nesterenkonia cremea TaxID=1882340 RepID=A0A917APP0_9MICC|nr:hypothetical protein [Nesterenkonia cremea]GGE64982.1 hypothetical protein GCM10011401_10150 [Nesterenkonia cremea]
MEERAKALLQRRLKGEAVETRWTALREGNVPQPLVVRSDEYSVDPTGGRSVSEIDIQQLREGVLADLGEVTGDQSREFDKRLALSLRKRLPILPAEAGRGDVWDYLTFVVFPDLTVSRFPAKNRDRFNGKSRRHALRRLWRRATVLSPEYLGGPSGLAEDEFAQILERQTTSLSPRISDAVASAIVSSGLAGGERREFARRLMKIITYRTGMYWLDDEDSETLSRFVDACAAEVTPSGTSS